MRGKPLTILSALSLAMLVLTCSLWVRALVWWDRVNWVAEDGSTQRALILSEGGTLGVIWEVPSSRGYSPGFNLTSDRLRGPASLREMFLGFSLDQRGPQWKHVRFPLWLPALLFALLPLHWLWVRRGSGGARGFEVGVGEGESQSAAEGQI